MKHVAVLMGGWSAEREVSLNSGNACAGAAEAAGYRVTRVDVTRDIARVLADLKPDVALNVLHGPPGEDGALQGLLEVMGIPYTHSGIMASAVAMQKEIAKTVLKAAGVPVPGGLVANRLDVARAHMLPPPYVIKPLSEGSSIGVYIVRADQAHPPQELMRPDWKYGERVMVEPFIPGKELTCAVIADKPTDVIEIIAHTAFYDYEAKYAPGGSTHILPAKVPADVYAECQRLALLAHNALGCRGVTRADFRWDDTKGVAGISCLEVNTQPGMTGTSLVPELAAYAGMPFPELARWMIEDASLGR